MPLLQTTVSGVVHDVNGTPVPNVACYVLKVQKSGVTLQYKKKKVATSNASGVLERSPGVPDFIVPRASDIWLSGNFFVGSTKFQVSAGVRLTIPDAATVTLESLGASVTGPTTGLTIKSNNVALANLFGTLDFSSAFTLTESPTGELNIAIPAGGGTWGSITGTLSSQTDLQAALDLKAPLASPALTGVPTAPTAAAATNTTQLATTAFVRTEVANLIASAPGALDTLDELAAALGDDANFATTVTNALALKAPLVSPSFTTPDLGVAVATSINKVALTQPATAATLTILNNKTLTVNKSLTLEGTDSTVMTFPTTSQTIPGLSQANIFSVNDAAALSIGPNGNTNPVVRIVTNVGSQADGISISGGASQAGTTIAALSSGSNSPILLTPKGTGQILLPDGTAAKPMLSFSSLPTTGIYTSGSNNIDFSIATVRSYIFSSSGLFFLTNSIPIFFGASSDATLGRDAAGVLKAGTTAANALGAILGGRVVSAKTANYPIVAATDNSKFFTNAGASGAVNFTLPTAVPGLTFSFYVDAAQTLQVTAGASTTIRIAGSVSAAAGNITNATVGGCVTLVAISATQWVALSHEGTWVVT